MNCESCRYWEPVDGGATHDEHLESRRFGRCAVIAAAEVSRMLHPIAFARASDGAELGDLLTRPGFGCLLFEPSAS